MHYTNVFTFINRLTNLIRLKSERVIRINIHACLKSDALAWYTHELSENEKNMMQLVPLEERRFKPDRITALARLDQCRYDWTAVRAGRSARSHAQTMLTLLKSTGTADTKDQICKIMMSIDASLARDRSEPVERMEGFMKKLDFCYENGIAKSARAASLRRPQVRPPTLTLD